MPSLSTTSSLIVSQKTGIDKFVARLTTHHTVGELSDMMKQVSG